VAGVKIMRRSSRRRSRHPGRLDERGPRNDAYSRGAPLNDGGRDALIVEASVLARLLGIRLLRLNANVIVARAQFMRPSPARYDALVRSSRKAAARPPAGSRAIGARLAEAERLIDEGAATLAASPSTSVAAPRQRRR
jgi:hypothetical protein